MLKSSLIIPLPPGSTAPAATGESKPAVGLYPCIGDDCGEYSIVRLDNKGRPYLRCSAKDITINGCKRGADGVPADVPLQTLEVYSDRLTQITESWPMAEPYRHFISAAWNDYLKETGGEHEHRA